MHSQLISWQNQLAFNRECRSYQTQTARRRGTSSRTVFAMTPPTHLQRPADVVRYHPPTPVPSRRPQNPGQGTAWRGCCSLTRRWSGPATQDPPTPSSGARIPDEDLTKRASAEPPPIRSDRAAGSAHGFPQRDPREYRKGAAAAGTVCCGLVLLLSAQLRL